MAIRRRMIALLVLAALPQSAQADWPFWANDGVRRGTREYYETKAADPPGARQHYKAGKFWPVEPRPTGPSQTFIHKYHHTHYWPQPYVCLDRENTHAILNSQVSNGWIDATTMYDYHFDAATGELNSHGQHHLAWIVTHVPAEYRQVNLAQGIDPIINSERVRSVEQYLTRLPGADRSLIVQMRVSDPNGRPAGEVQRIFKAAQENAPPPILSKLTAGDEGNTN